MHKRVHERLKFDKTSWVMVTSCATNFMSFATLGVSTHCLLDNPFFNKISCIVTSRKNLKIDLRDSFEDRILGFPPNCASVLFITSQRGAQQILDSDGYIYSRKKSSDTALTSTWRCAKYNPPTKCKCHIYLALADNSLTLDTAAEVNQTLPNLESLARVVQRSRASSSVSAQHADATTSEDFILPSTCTSTRRDEPFVLYDGKTDRGVRVIAFSTTRNMKTLAKYPDWIADGTFYVAPKIFPQSYTIHSVVDSKCLPLIYILAGDKKGDTYRTWWRAFTEALRPE
ncbi:hypothetical protein ACHWQZ_G008159 [Mnemiopsis leidyi]